MQGFFSTSQTTDPGMARGKSCAACGLYKGPLNPVMPAAGKGAKGILNIGEAPGEKEDRKGKPWQGKVGRLLQKTYRELGIELFEDCRNVNAVNCRPPKNREPSPHEIGCCWNKIVHPAIQTMHPRVIVLLGNAAIQSIIGMQYRGELGGVTKWRSWTIPDPQLGAWICPTYHPSFISRYDDEAALTVWKQDLYRAIRLADSGERPKPLEDDSKRVTIVEGDEDIASLLRRVNDEAPEIAFDYETTGLKPHAEGHRIVSASIADSEDRAWAFMMPEAGPAKSAFKRLLRNPEVPKIAQNMKFEDTWSVVQLGVAPQGWTWDTMQAAHIMDNRPGITSLKFQVYVRFGIADYSSHIEPYLRPADNSDGANSINQIDDLIKDERGRHDLLIYNGLDSLYEMRLANLQRTWFARYDTNRRN